VEAWHPGLLREYRVVSKEGGEARVRRAPLILVELTDGHLEEVGHGGEEALTQYLSSDP
jgi:hypothetical protein